MAVLAAGAAVMFGAPIAPWNFFGMAYLMVTPMAILGACTGYVAGELWVMGQTREHRRAGIGHFPRKAMGLLGLAVPAAAAVAMWLNQDTADARKGDAVTREVLAVAAGLENGDVVLSDGAMDELLEMATARAGKSVTVACLPKTRVEAYKTWLGETRFGDARSQSLLALGMGPFLQDWLGRAGEEAVALNTPEALREFGDTVSDGLTSRLGDGGTAAEEAERNRAFRERMEALAGETCSQQNPVWAYRQWVLRAASKQANNTAFRLLEEGDEAGAEEVLLSARRMYPKNLSVLLNLWGLAAKKGDGSEEAYREEWAAAMGPKESQARLWRLGVEYGWVYNTGMLVRQGMMWAVSGKPKQAEAELRRSQGPRKGKDIDVELKSFLGQMYLFSGDQKQGEEYYRAVLEEKPDDPTALHALAELAIQQGRLEDAREGLARLRELGVPAERLRFEELLLTAAEGRYAEAVRGLAALAEEKGDDLRVWGAMAVLAGKAGDDGAREKAIGALRKQKSKSPATRLLLAHLLSGQGDWAAARSELEQLVRMNPGHAGAWEMLLRVDYAEHKRDQAEDHVRVLLTLDPGNAFGNLLLASFQRERGQLALAESSYRAALATQRSATTLNDLADLLMRRPEGRAEARELLDEALGIAPGDATAHMTRAELGLLEGRTDEAEKDLQVVLAAYPGHPEAVLLAARLYAATGKREAAMELVAELEKKRSSLSPEGQEVFRRFQAEMREGNENP